MTRDYSFPRLLVTVTPTEVISHAGSIPEESSTCNFFPRQALHKTSHHREYRIRITTELNGTSRNYDDNSDNDDDSTTLVLCETQMRFSEFYHRFTESSHFSIKPASSMFPPRGFLWDNYTTNMTNVQYRAKEIQTYLDCMLNDSGIAILLSPFLYKALEVDEEGQKQFGDISQQRQYIQDRLEEERREKVRRTLKKEKNRWEKAQTMNLSRRRERTSLRFSVPREFQIECIFWSQGRMEISHAPNDTMWFQLAHTDFPQFLPFADITFELESAAGQPLLEIKCSFGFFDYLCEISYITNSGEVVEAVQVHRYIQLALFEEEYIISSTGKTVQDNYSCSGSPFSLSLGVNGRDVAALERDFFGNHYTLVCDPGQDCLLLVGISCAVAKIQEEIHRRSVNRNASSIP